jgi:hypothetical protein
LVVCAAPLRISLGLAVLLIGAVAAFAPRAEAAWLTIAPPVEVSAGWTRITGRYANAGTDPRFRATARCGGGDVHVLDSRVYSRREDGAVWLDLRGTPNRLEPPGVQCAAPVLSIEMLVDSTVVASTPVAQRDSGVSSLNPAVLAAPPPPIKTASRLGLGGQKYGAPSGKRTEAGVTWAVDSHVSVQLNYQRTAEPPMMSYDHDDGFLTRLRVGF